jgi:hypothetical protein
LRCQASKHCSTCGQIETDAHLFFHCDFARALWFSTDTPLQTDTLPNEDNGVQLILSTFITDSISYYLLQKILTLLLDTVAGADLSCCRCIHKHT